MINPMTRVIDKIMSRRAYQYWALQAIGWSGYLFFLVVSALLWDKESSIHNVYSVMAAVTGLLVSLCMHRAFKLLWDKPPVPRGFYTIVTVMLGTAAWSFWKFYIALHLYDYNENVNLVVEYIYWYSYSFFILLSWTGLYYGIRFYQMMQHERDHNLRVTAMAHQAQLKMLRYQLNPHFLFNTLNAISTLIMDSKGTMANRMVTSLSKFLRYSLDNDPMQKVSLEQEVGAMRLYLDIEKIRFEERLEVDVDVGEDARRALIPSLLLQPLVENAIKYAVAKSEGGGRILLRARVFADELLLELSDNGPGIDMKDGQLPSAGGVGLANARERLQVLYGDRHSCKLSTAQPHGLKISIRIPYETEETAVEWRN